VNTIDVSQFSFDATEADLREVFSAYVRLLTDETRNVVEIYQWFMTLKEQATGETGRTVTAYH